MYQKNTFPIFHFYTLFEFLLFSLYYLNFFEVSKEGFLFKILLIFIPIIVYVDYEINGLYKMDTIASSIEAIIISAFCIQFFYSILKKPIYDDILKEPVFWINIAVLLYFSGNLLLFLFNNYVLAFSLQKGNFLWLTIHSFFNLVYSILTSIGIWKLRKA